ncbi:chemotaxis protein [Nitratireductor sp. GCM10026969]|uniref:chemotaxis protein n=1 Tax=Nitratireductor sp. GCM10026969 TaxID=3252645 RepID=UPI00361FAED9
MKGRLAAAALLAAFSGTHAPAEELEPYEMVRSLQRVQDRIADGDHAALPMQAKLLGIIDGRLRAATLEAFEDPRNRDAVLIYGASGGNPETLDMIVSRLNFEGAEETFARGVVRYAHGDAASARQLLREIEPLDLDGVLAAPLALMAGSLVTQEDPAAALDLFDRARLLSPGTLIEEAALRRSVAISASLKATERFLRAAEQYVRRFVRSPYASRYAEDFVSGVVALQAEIDLNVLEAIVAEMDREKAHAIYLRIARQSAIDSHRELLAFAAGKAREYAPAEETEDDPRALLYANAARVASPDVDDVLAVLGRIDESRLSSGDRRLLKAAREIAADVIAPPALAKRAEAAPAEAEDETDAAPATAEYVAATRDKLRAIDVLLGEEARP